MDTAALLTLQNAQTTSGTAAQQALASQMKNGKSNAKLGLDFEFMCLSNLLKPMFEGLSTDGPFGGGEGKSAMRSFLIDAIGKQMAQHGGIGISDMMQKQLLKLQGAH